MTQLKSFILVILLALPIYPQGMSQHNVIGFDYKGAFGYPDLPNIGMIVEEGLNPSDSVLRINSYGWTIKNGSNEWVMQTDFEKPSLTQEYSWPDSVLIDINITNIESNVYFLGMLISLEDTTGDGSVSYLSRSIPIELGWQTISFWAGDGIFVENMLIHGIGIHIKPSSMDSGYVGGKFQFNDMRLKYDNGDTILIEPFQVDWTTDVEPVPGLVPSGFILEQNYPNPFNPTTTIRYEIPELSSVKLTVYSLTGEKITELVNSEQASGVYEVPFDATNLASGTYIYTLQTNNFVMQRKMILLK
jgi:hypothetical protein